MLEKYEGLEIAGDQALLLTKFVGHFEEVPCGDDDRSRSGLAVIGEFPSSKETPRREFPSGCEASPSALGLPLQVGSLRNSLATSPTSAAFCRGIQRVGTGGDVAELGDLNERDCWRLGTLLIKPMGPWTDTSFSAASTTGAEEDEEISLCTT